MKSCLFIFWFWIIGRLIDSGQKRWSNNQYFDEIVQGISLLQPREISSYNNFWCCFRGMVLKVSTFPRCTTKLDLFLDGEQGTCITLDVIIHLVTPWLEESIWVTGDSTRFKMSSSFVARIAVRFTPLNFSVVPGFPNAIPDIEEWRDILPNFREDVDDSPARHLFEFHELMHQLHIYHEDVLMKLFMFSLRGDSRL